MKSETTGPSASTTLLRDPSELEGALLVEATAVLDQPTTTPSHHIAATIVQDAITVPTIQSSSTPLPDERYAAHIATQRGREAAAAEIAAVRAHNQRQRGGECIENKVPPEPKVDSAVPHQRNTPSAKGAGYFGTGGYQVQEYDTTEYTVAEYDTTEYKSVYDRQ